MAKRTPPRNRFGITDTDHLRQARARFKFADEAESDQRQREREDLAFYAGDQWPADIKLARQGQQPINGQPATPSRPTLVINNVREPVRQVSSEAYSADLGVTITAAEDFGDLNVLPDETEIKLREGLVRKIQRESQARDARNWAFDRAVKAGRGYYLVNVRFLPGKTWDREVCVERLYNQACVLLDPSHQEPDGSDAEWEFTYTDLLWDEYAAQYPKLADGEPNPLATKLSDSEWTVLGDEYPKWFRYSQTKEGKDSPDKIRAVRVVNYWYTESTPRELCVMTDGSLAWEDELQKEQKKDIADSRNVVDKTIKFCKIDGAQILEETEWEGPDMPIIKVLGEEIQPYDGERRAEGMVRPSRDPQMGLNYMISKQVEMVGLTPLTPLIGDPEATDGYPEWDQLNTRVVPMARYRTYDDQGRQMREPHRPNADPNLLPISQSIALFSAQIEKTTAVPAARLGDIDPVTRSGKALDRLTANSKNSTSNFLMNLIRSIRREGEVENNLLYPVYGKLRNGRLVRLLMGDGKTEQLAMLHDQPQSPMAMQMQQQMQRAQMVAKLTPDAKFNIDVKVTRDFDTRKQEEHQSLAEIIAADPAQMMAQYGDLFFGTMDTPGHEEMAERAKVTLDPRVQAYLSAKAQGNAPPTPKELQLMQQNQQLTQTLQKMGMVIQTKQIESQTKVQGDIAKTQMQESAETQRAREKNETTITVAELSALAKELQDTRALFMEERARLGSQAHDAGMAGAQADHEAAMAHAQSGVDQQQAAQDQQMQQSQMAHEAALQGSQPQPNGQAGA